MMNIRKVSVPVHGGFVQVRMCMRFGAIPLECMAVLMVFVMAMRMRMLGGFVDVLVNVLFTEMQPQTERHECRGNA